MRSIKTPVTMQTVARSWRVAGRRIGFVPTMGYLHEGHISLVHEARKRVGPKGVVVVSIYVNPTQFAPTEDLAKYPRDLARDAKLCRQAGVDALFLPTDGTMYPGRDEGRYSTYVVEESLSRGMEGVSRPTHFRGVATVVAKLFNSVLPDVAVFGAKDWQQAAVVRRMTIDLNFPIRVIVAPTRREPDGLAMSSRNAYLTTAQRAQATVLWRCLQLCRTRVEQARRLPAAALLKEIQAMVGAEPEARLDYAAFFNSETLEPCTEVQPGDHLALAVFMGATRLIDNAKL